MGIKFDRPDVEVIKIGFGTGDYMDFELTEGNPLLGFYGAAND